MWKNRKKKKKAKLEYHSKFYHTLSFALFQQKDRYIWIEEQNKSNRNKQIKNTDDTLWEEKMKKCVTDISGKDRNRRENKTTNKWEEAKNYYTQKADILSPFKRCL